MRVALVHDWLTGMRGGERVLEGLLELFPDAEIFTLVHAPGTVSARIEARPIHVPPGGRLRLATRHYRYALPLLPALVERFDLRAFDLVISSSHCVAKGVRPPAGTPHLCYCHTPMRYVWDQYDAYFGRGRATVPVRAAMGALAPRLRDWDRTSAVRVTSFVANSRHVRERIRRCYEREAAVVHPPVEVERFRPAGQREDFYVCLGALVPYKRVDLVVDAFNRLGRRLLVVGEGGERARLQARAGATIEFTGRVSDARVSDLLGRARGVVHAGVEDFGITLVEAQAAGAPVVAFAAGGASETVVDERVARNGRAATGVLFQAQTAAAVAEAVLRLEARPVTEAALLANARRFTRSRFLGGMRQAVDRLLATPAP
jgi:glycosyltransferase involved in cell wall biosynthesis